MPATFTKAQASKLLNVSEMKLYEESRIVPLRKFSASQLDRRVERTRALRDKARDQLQRQRVAQREKTGSKRGASGDANQQRSKDKVTLIGDILKRFEGQLKVARKNEKAGIVPKAAPQRRGTRKAAISKAQAPGKDFTASRMRARIRMDEEAGSAMKARKAARKATGVDDSTKKKTTTKATAKKATAKKAVAKKVVAKKAATKKAVAKAPVAEKAAKKAVAKRPSNTPAGGKTGGKRTANLRALNAAGGGKLHEGFSDVRAQNIALEQKLEAGRKTPIQGHVSARGRRNQGKRDSRG